jgi:hypothetical protein
MKILICGMPRSMTTWALNVIRELVGSNVIQVHWVEPHLETSELGFASAQGSVLAKCHHFSAQLATAADVIVYSYRDLRTAAVSAQRKFGSLGTLEQLNEWVESGHKWMACADIALRYEAVTKMPLLAIEKLRTLLVQKFGAEKVTDLPNEEVLIFLKYSQLEQVEKIADVKHPIIREALQMMGFKTPQVEITTLADIPAGTGLESPRDLRRLQPLRRWSHEQEIKSFFSRSARTRRTHGARAPW